MAYWKTGIRKINGRRRKVRLLVERGRIVSVRMYGVPTYTDKTARKRGHKRVKFYWNQPKSNDRRDAHRRNLWM